jgi:hypothetical protein
MSLYSIALFVHIVSAIAVVFGAVLGGAAGFAGVRRMRSA